MIRIIDGVACEGKLSSQISVKAHDLGNGHLELSGVRCLEWSELEWSQLAIDDYLQAVERCRLERELETGISWEDEKHQNDLNRAASRAKRRVRRLCKAMGTDTLLTLTYRSNVTDLAICKANLKEFVRRVRRVLPGFSAVCGFEQQERGAWHVHMATIRVPSLLAWGSAARVKSFNVLRAIWRSVTKENGGTVNVAKSKYGKRRSAAEIAAYIAKYISKAFAEGVAGSNRWTKYGDCVIPEPVNLGRFPNMLAAVEACYALVDGCASVVDQHLSKWDDWFFLVVENQAVAL